MGCDSASPPPTAPDPTVHTIPIVVHVIHHGEPIGSGANLSKARIEGQLRILNDDFRRRAGTRGHNTHPDGGDTKIEFVLARVAPDGSPTDGIVRVDATKAPDPNPSEGLFNYYAQYGYWPPERYVNVWTMPLAEELTNVILGMATGPETDLPGAEFLAPGEPDQAEGILINAAHFGESDLGPPHDLGRTLTHEMGHYLGLLHTWGGGDCERNDYCSDTPPVAEPVLGCPSTAPLGCDGRSVMIANYMNFTSDSCMNIFTLDQIARMHYVLANSPRRKSLLRSAGLGGS